jgi:magnesium transporter
MMKKPLIHLGRVGLRERLTPFKAHAKKSGLPPGSLVHIGEQKTETPVISLIEFDEKHFDVATGLTVDEVRGCRETNPVSWVNLTGIHDVSLFGDLGAAFAIHPLALEDILNTQHRPKLEEYDDFTLIILKMLYFNDKARAVEAEQVSLIVGSNYVLTFQEREGDLFDGVRERLQRSHGRIRQRGSDYLAYALIDSIVDGYFQILEKIGDCLADLEEGLLADPSQELQGLVHHFKRELMLLRKSVWPLREVIGQLQKGELGLISEGTRAFLRDLYDHTIQVLDTVELYRDTVSGLHDLYLSSVSNRMNEIMKVLTIMASIFIPLSFIAGVYGMNFEFMPELKWRWGYFAVWGVMLGCFIGMVYYFRKRKWL